MELNAAWWLALLWLAGLSLLALVYFVRLVRNSDYSLWESCLYLPTYLMGRLVWRVHFRNSPPAAIQRGAILVANHRSSVDPFFVQLAAKRRVHWMVAKEYCNHFLFGPILRAVQAIPTNRTGMDTASTKAAMRITKEGRLVGMFPEGRLNHTQQPLLSIRSGAAAVAIRSAVPIIPLYIEGSPYRREVWSPLFMAAHVAITFGEPIYPGAKLGDSTSGFAENGDEAAKANPDPEEGSVAGSRSPTDEDPLAESDWMILCWAKQILQMANRPDFPIELSAKRRHRKRL